MAKETKQDVINDITDRIGARRIPVSTGSTELKMVFELVVRRFGLRLDTSVSKPELAESIARHAGVEWHPTFDSRDTPSGGGSTVTIDGLRAVRRAVDELLRRERSGRR